jgi:hypothetical protein
MPIRPMLAVVLITVAAAVACDRAKATPTPAPAAETGRQSATSAPSMMGQMGGVPAEPGSKELAPLVRGFYRGGEVFFIHTEASDSDVAGMLTMMMGPSVVHVPELADVPGSAVASVYVFKNGVAGQGPFGFQPDIFDSVPGDPDYSPLRSVNLVTWNEGASPVEMHSVEEIEAASQRGQVRVERPRIVVNMPILIWPGNQR